MSKLIPFIQDECDLTESNLLSLEIQTSQEILSQVYVFAKKIADSRDDISALIENGNTLIHYLEDLHEKGLDESTYLNEANEEGKREADAWSCVICGALLKLGLNDAIYKKVDISNYMTNHFCKLFPS